MWQQRELESHLVDTVDWGKWLVDFNARKTQLVSVDWSDSSGNIDVNMDGSSVEEKSSFKILGLSFTSKLDQSSYIIFVAKMFSKRIGALVRFAKFLSPDAALCHSKYITRPCM